MPALISSKVEKKKFKILLNEMGFNKNNDIILKIVAGICVGVIFFSFGDFLIIFFRNIVIERILGTEFVEEGQEGMINTIPLQPNLIQIIILLIFQIIIIGPCEEAFFRVFIIKKTRGKLKLGYSIVLSSIIFAFYHVPLFLVPLSTFITFFGYYFVLGLLLALVFISFDNSIIPISVAHSCFNILVLLI
ncbi:MAG: lysostaphin resistance A-like protein [Candidatus Heimdallarchaeota archaeon]